MKNKRNKAEDRRLKRHLKEEVYTKYTDLMTSLLEQDYYKGFHSTLTTFLSLNMAAEATKKNLLKMGAPVPELENARRTSIEEMWNLMKLQESGALKQLIDQHEREQEQAKKK